MKEFATTDVNSQDWDLGPYPPGICQDDIST